MEQDKYYGNGPNPGMYGSDREVFNRVWRRVMPEDRPDSPITLIQDPNAANAAAYENAANGGTAGGQTAGASAGNAAVSPSGTQTPSYAVPSNAAGAGNAAVSPSNALSPSYTVPSNAAGTGNTAVSPSNALSPSYTVPSNAAGSGNTAVKPAYTYPANTAKAGGSQVKAAQSGEFCLGSDSAVYGEQLQDFILDELADCRGYQALAARVRVRAAKRTLCAIAAEELRHARRLAAAYFLIFGLRFWPACGTASPRIENCTDVLRDRFSEELRGEASYRAAAEATNDACLRDLYLELADEEANHAAAIRGLLELLTTC